MTITHTTASQEGNDTFTGNNTHSGTETFNGPLIVNAAATMSDVTLGTANILSVNNIRQQAGAAFLVQDPNGRAHFFISNSAPYTNTFLAGNGSGGILLGSAAKASVADTTGNIVTAGSITLQNTSQLLPGTIVNDTLGGFLFTTNAGKGWQIANSTGQLQGFAGVNILLQGSSSGSITLAVPAAAGSNTLTLPAATDTLVGKATTDTLSNKTFTGASSGNSVTLVNWQSSAGAITGNGADQNIYSFSIPGNTMGSGKGIYVIAGWQHTTGAAAVTTKFKYGATTVATNSEAGTGLTVVAWYVMNNPGSTSAQTAWQEIGQDAGSAVVYSPQFATPAENTTGAVTAAVTFNVANTDAVTPKFFKIELVQ